MNQGLRVVVKRIQSLNEFIADNKFDIMLFTTNHDCIKKIVPLLSILETGNSKISLSSLIDKQKVEIRIKENIKLSANLINDLSQINGIDNVTFS